MMSEEEEELACKEEGKRKERYIYNIRLLVGFYLLYLVYGLCRDFLSGQAGHEVIAAAAIALFAVAGSVMVFTSVRYTLKNRKKD